MITIGYNPVEYWPSLWNGKRKRTIIHVDVLPSDLDNCYSPTVELTGSIDQTLETLTPAVKRSTRSPLSLEVLDMIVA
ncbi:hypothetical protein ABTF95_18280, partial [Acinetobacter baumannii]